ncbi:MAG: hypothetical protein JWO36_2358 [Myxococcales bacterium]|nr:hypothetical protein [Myxococcales bacterium]
MKLRTALELGRASSLPTVITNVIAAIVLAGGRPGVITALLTCVAMMLLYVSGGFLNDAFDRDLDRIDQPRRPIPSGAARAGTVFDAGFAMLGAGLLLVIGLALATGAGWKPIVSAVALASLIVFYNADHKDNPLAPLVMGLCRAGIYTTAALLVRPDICLEVLVGCVVLIAYLVGQSYVARGELSSLWPLGLLGVPFVIAWPQGSAAFVIYAAFLLWILRALFVTRGRLTKAASLVAGISLLDALLVSNLGRADLAIIALVAFAATTVLQRVLRS